MKCSQTGVGISSHDCNSHLLNAEAVLSAVTDQLRVAVAFVVVCDI